MCEIAENKRRIYRDQDPPRIVEMARRREIETLGFDADRSLFENQQQQQQQQQQQRRDETASETIKVSRTFVERDSASSSYKDNTSARPAAAGASTVGNLDEELTSAADKPAVYKVPFSSSPSSTTGQKSNDQQVISNGVKKEEDSSSELLTNGREMAPQLGVPRPPPAPHMSPDGLILPRKPYNPCLISNNHKDLRREMLFNNKFGKNVLNQKSELQRALEKQRETAMRKEAERNREETYKDDPRTALQRALEQRAKQIQRTEQPKNVEPPNPLVTARAKLRPHTDSQ